jgi:glycosyltransferase involved in cell wall biosynthesis
MRILYICLDRGIPIGGSKGGAVHIEELIRAFEAEGHMTAVAGRFVLASPGSGPVFVQNAVSPLLRRGGTWRRELGERLAGPGFQRAIRQAIASFQPELVYERYSLFRSEGLTEARRAGLPFVLEVNAPLAWEARRFRRLRFSGAAECNERRVWREAGLVVVPSQPVADLVRGVGQPSVLVVPNAVDPQRFYPLPRDPDRRQRLGLDGRFVVGFAGSLKPWHGLDTLAKAVASIPEGIKPALLLVGHGPERDSIYRTLLAAGVPTVITGAVPHEEVPSYLALMDACFAGLTDDPALHYFSPLKALEYLAAGRPTVVARAGSLAQLAAVGVALGYRPGDSADLAAQLVKLASNPELGQRLSTAGRAYAEGRSWRAAARTILQAATTIRPAA